MSNKLYLDPSLQVVLDLLKKEIFANLNCHAIGKIESFDASNQTAQIKIAYSKISINDDANIFVKAVKEYPLLVSCPVLIASGGKGSLRFPIQSGDECLVLFNDRDIDNWFNGSGNSILASDRQHSFSDAMAIVGIKSLAQSLSEYSTEKTELVHDKLKISMGDKLKIANQTANLSLFDILFEMMAIIETLTTTNCVVGYPVSISPAQSAQITVLKNKLSLLME